MDQLLLNHHPICSLLYAGNESGALKVFKETFTLVEKDHEVSTCKLYVLSLNFSIYNYILMKENVSLHKCCITHNNSINNALSFSNIKQAGIDLIIHYANCKDYSIEKFSNPGIKKAIQYMHQHLNEPLTLDTVCDSIHLNKCYFCTLFKNDTGLTFTQYLNKIRIDAAKHLMQETTLSLDEIAYRCGFNTYSYFCTTFKKITGQPPSAFPTMQK
ncbi:MAG: helix-turn-helix domain-containing protein [Niameybacter sp.]|uniref:helix-turn-helix domain-containing protein n=2 Tax=Niameybacter sp. TaxID=2033640 RepID=UPI002FCAC264